MYNISYSYYVYIISYDRSKCSFALFVIFSKILKMITIEITATYKNK